MTHYCSRCGVETTEAEDMHCRKILVSEVKKLLALGDLDSIRYLVRTTRSDEVWESWKWEMYERLTRSLRQSEEELRLAEEMEKERETEQLAEQQSVPFLQHAELLIQSGHYRGAQIYILENQMTYPSLPLLSKFKGSLYRDIPTSYRVPIYYTPRKNWRLFEEVRVREGLYEFVHMTDERNVALIKQHGGLFSKQAMEKYYVSPKKYASSELSWNIDKKKGLWDYIHLSIREHPMMFGNSTLKPVTLFVDSRFVFASETKFSNINTTDSMARIGSGFDDFNRIRFEIAKNRWVAEEEKSYYQAEILVRHCIPIEFIRFSS